MLLLQNFPWPVDWVDLGYPKCLRYPICGQKRSANPLCVLQGRQIWCKVLQSISAKAIVTGALTFLAPLLKGCGCRDIRGLL